MKSKFSLKIASFFAPVSTYPRRHEPSHGYTFRLRPNSGPCQNRTATGHSIARHDSPKCFQISAFDGKTCADPILGVTFHSDFEQLDAYLDKGVDPGRYVRASSAPQLVVGISGLLEEEGRRRKSITEHLKTISVPC